MLNLCATKVMRKAWDVVYTNTGREMCIHAVHLVDPQDEAETFHLV